MFLRRRRAYAVCARFDSDHESCTCGKGMLIIGIDVFRTDNTVRSTELNDQMDTGYASEAITPLNSRGSTPGALAHRLPFS